VPFCKWVKDIKGISNGTGTQWSFWLHTLDTLGCVAEGLNPQSLSKAASISGCEDSFAACKRIELGLESDKVNAIRDRQPSYYMQWTYERRFEPERPLSLVPERCCVGV
jgi:hypothetical protein